MVRKVYAKDLREKDQVHTVFKVTKKQKTQSRGGKTFLMVTLADKTGELEARVFDDVDAADGAFAAGDYVLVRGEIITFHGRAQLVIAKVERLDPEPIDPKEFTPPEKAPSEPEHNDKPVTQIREVVGRVHDPFVKKLLFAFLDDPQIAAGLPRAPAAKSVHHAYRGGLADHLLSVLKLAHRIADHYPMVDRDLLVAGALLHDIGKVGELSYDKDFAYTDEGRLVGHLVMTAQNIRQKASHIEGFPPALEHHLTHLVLAHHGQLEYGSPKLPMTLEALLVHLIDLMDSRVASWLELMGRDSGGRWVDATKQYGRHLWKGPSSHRRKDRKPRATPSAPAQKLAFKPLSELAKESPAPSEEPEKS